MKDNLRRAVILLKIFPDPNTFYSISIMKDGLTAHGWFNIHTAKKLEELKFSVFMQPKTDYLEYNRGKYKIILT